MVISIFLALTLTYPAYEKQSEETGYLYQAQKLQGHVSMCPCVMAVERCSIVEVRLAQAAERGEVSKESKRHRACFDASAHSEPHPRPCVCHSLKCLAYALASERRLSLF